MTLDRTRVAAWGAIGLLGVVQITAVLALLALLTGCTGRYLTEAQLGQLSQGKADVVAARQATDAEARQALYTAAAARLMAGVADLDLPAPATPATDLATPAAAHREAEAAKAAEADPPSGLWKALVAGAGGAALLALGLLRSSPGAFGMLANLAHGLLAPKLTREMRAAEKKASEVAQQAIAYGHALTQAAESVGLKPTVERLKDDFGAAQDKLGLRKEIDTLLAAFKAGRLPVKPLDSKES